MIVFLQNIDDDDDDGKIADRFHFSLIEKWEIDEEKQKKTQKKRRRRDSLTVSQEDILITRALKEMTGVSFSAAAHPTEKRIMNSVYWFS